jgi:hypothetical protein
MSTCNNWRLRWVLLLLLLGWLSGTARAAEALYDSFNASLDRARWRCLGEASGPPLDMLRAPHLGSLLLGARGVEGGSSRQGCALLERPETITGGSVYLAVQDWWATGCQGSEERTMTRVGFTMELGHDYWARVMVAGVSAVERLAVLGQIRYREGLKDARTVEEVDLGPVQKGWPIRIGLSWYPGGVYFTRQDCAQPLNAHGRLCGKAGRWDSIAVPVMRLAKSARMPESSRMVEAVSEAGKCEGSDAFSLSAVHEVYVERAADK